MARAIASAGSRIYTFRISLAGSSPEIWRRFQVEDTMTLGELHYVLQIVMGWTNSHLHEFVIRKERFGTPDADDFDGSLVQDEDAVALRDVLTRKGSKCDYIYDFGDDWWHTVVLEGISRPGPDTRYPVCTEGEAACPPEDCGGLGGYYRMLAILQDPKHAEYESLIEWLGEGFDSQAFDVEETNAGLNQMGIWRALEEGDDGFAAWAQEASPAEYEGAVGRLLTLGAPTDRFDYMQLNIGPSHVPSLIGMATDMALHHASSDSAEVWAPVHAWRALGQLHAETAIEPLLSVLRLADEVDDDWASTDVPKVLCDIGPTAVPFATAFLRDPKNGPWARIAVTTFLSKCAQRHPESRHPCVAGLTTQLQQFEVNDVTLNAFLVSALVDLRAVESASAMERAFLAGTVDLSVQGDWEEVQIELGLLEKRKTPAPRHGWLLPDVPALRKVQDMLHPAPPVPPSKTRQKKTKQRKQQKQARKKNRRK